MSEIADVTDMLHGFEEHNSCNIQMEIVTTKVAKTPSLVIVMTAYPRGVAMSEASCLASVSVTCSALNLKNWNSALTHVMYALDFQLALNELGHAAPIKA